MVSSYVLQYVIPSLMKITDCLESRENAIRQEYIDVFSLFSSKIDETLMLDVSRFYWKATREWREACPQDLKNLFFLSLLTKEWRHEYIKQVVLEYGTDYRTLCLRTGVQPL